MSWLGSLALAGGWHALWEALLGAYLWVLCGCPSLGPGFLSSLAIFPCSCCLGGVTEVSVQVPPDSVLVTIFILLGNSFHVYFEISKSKKSPEYLQVLGPT